MARINAQIKQLGFVGNISREFLDRHSALKGEIDALKNQNQAFLTQNELQAAKANADMILKRCIEDMLNAKMKEFNDSLFTTKKKPPHVRFNAYNSYKFETPDNTGTGSNYKGMIVYDLAVLFTTALPALAHDLLLFKNLGKDIEAGIRYSLLAKFTKDENVTTEVFSKICQELKCDVADMMEFVPDPTSEKPDETSEGEIAPFV